MTHRWMRTAAAAALVMGVAACGGDDDDDAGGEDGAGTTVPVQADLVVRAVPTIRWEEENYTATAGEVTVALENEDPSAQHTLAIVDANDQQLPEVLEADSEGDTDTGTYTLQAGTYTIICTVPGHSSMQATLTVT